MELLEIQESKKQQENLKKIYAIGIDFGTTNSLAAYSVNKVATILKNDFNEDLTKSIYTIDGIELKSIKRLIGKSYDEITSSEYLHSNYDKILVNDNGKIKLNINGKLYSPIEVVAEILKRIKNYASIRIGEEIDSCVLTIPAYFDETARNEIKFAAKLANLNILRLLTEPVSAAYFYGLESKKEGYYLVYDFGGGTFDISLINMKMGAFRVILTAGDNLLGGDDLDILFKEYLSDKFSDISTELAQSLKEKLSEKEEIVYSGHKIHRDEFNQVINNLIDKTINIIEDLLSISEIDLDDILGIILVGGSSKIESVRDKLKKRFNLELFFDQDPERIVALGASLVAENLTFKNNNLIIDVLPLSIGLETYGGFVEKIIERNTQIPCSITRQYTNYADNQTAMKFHIVQGEREMAQDCRSIGFFELKNMEPMKAGLAKIEVTFTVDADGLIKIEAIDKNTGIREIIEISSTYGISSSEIDEMIKNAYKNAISDHNEKILLTSIIDARDLIKSINLLLYEYSDNIEEKIIQPIKDTINDLDNVILIKDLIQIKDQTKKLKEISNFLVEMKLNHDILSVIKGKNINSI